MTFSKQPLVWLNVLALALSLGASFGFSLSPDRTAAVMALAQAVATAVGWTQVTPVATAQRQIRAVARRKAAPSAGKPPTGK